jgi:AraC-like DNA-binding protein
VTLVHQKSLAAGSTIPVAFALVVLQGAARSGVDLRRLFSDNRLDPALLEDPSARIDRRRFIDLMLAVMRQTEDEFLGFGQGFRSRPGTFSMMAHAVINCPTLESAMRRSLHFYELFGFDAVARLEMREGEALVVFNVGDKSLVDFREFITETLVFLTIRFCSWLIGKPIVPTRITLDFPPSMEAEQYKELFPCPVLYGQSRSQIVLDQTYMDLPLVQNPLSLSRFLKDSLAQLIDGNFHSVGLPAQIRAIISKEYGNNFPDFQVICDKLNMTPQTLRRRLKEGNTSYQEIKDSIRKDASIYYLSKPDLSIDEIAMLMGFSEASSFHRAFKKWTGKTPSAFRRDMFNNPD